MRNPFFASLERFSARFSTNDSKKLSQKNMSFFHAIWHKYSLYGRRFKIPLFSSPPPTDRSCRHGFDFHVDIIMFSCRHKICRQPALDGLDGLPPRPRTVSSTARKRRKLASTLFGSIDGIFSLLSAFSQGSRITQVHLPDARELGIKPGMNQNWVAFSEHLRQLTPSLILVPVL